MLVGVATGAEGVSEAHLAGADMNGKLNGEVVVNPPDIISGSVVRKAVPTSLDLCTRREWDERELEEMSGVADESAKVKHGHSRTRQRNVHCLETEV